MNRRKEKDFEERITSLEQQIQDCLRLINELADGFRKWKDQPRTKADIIHQEKKTTHGHQRLKAITDRMDEIVHSGRINNPEQRLENADLWEEYKALKNERLNLQRALIGTRE